MQSKANSSSLSKHQRTNIGNVSVDAAPEGAKASGLANSGAANGTVNGDYLKLLLSHERRFDKLELENQRLKASCETLQQQNNEHLQTIQKLKKQSDTEAGANKSSSPFNSRSPLRRRRAVMKPSSLDELPVLDKSEFVSVKPMADVTVIRRMQKSLMQISRSTQEIINSGGRWCFKLLF